MNIRFVSPDLAWTESMKKEVRSKVVEPLSRHLKKDDFEMSIHLEIGWARTPILAPRFELWVVLQTFDGRLNAVVRRAGPKFSNVVDDVSRAMREELERPSRRRFAAFA